MKEKKGKMSEKIALKKLNGYSISAMELLPQSPRRHLEQGETH